MSLSLPDEDVEYLDEYARSRGYGSRSAVVHKAVRLLRASELTGDYADAWTDWSESDDARVWETAPADGLTDG